MASRLGLLLGVGAVLLVAALGAAIWLSYAVARGQAEDQARAVARLVGREAESVIEAADLTLRQMADLAVTTDWSDPRAVAQATRELNRFKRLTPTAFRLFVFGPDGRLRATSVEDMPPGIGAADRDYFRAQIATDAGLYFGEPVAAKIDGTPIFVLSRRVTTAEGRFDGIVSLSFEPEVIAAFYRSLDAVDGAAFAWVRADGTALVREPNMTPGELPQARMAPLAEVLPEGKTVGVPYVSPFDGERRLAFVRPVGDHPLYVKVGISERAVRRAWVRGAWPYFGFALLALAGLGLAARRALSWARAEDGYRGDLARLTRELRAANRHLEDRVAERTAELSSAVEQKELLLGELSHRVKNTLATVQSIAAQTLQHEPAPERFRASFTARLRALAQAHNLLSQTDWQGADLRDIVREDLAPHLDGCDDDRVRIEGGTVHLEPRAALTLGMAFHELATNAAKYGALSVPTGQVSVSWATPDREGGRVLDIVWAESGGPRVERPQRRGFGSAMIERSIEHELDGTVELAFEPTGLRCAIEVPLPH